MRAPDILVIANPAARAAPPRVMNAVTAAWRARGAVELRTTERPGHATCLARKAAESGADVVVALGGDGTANEVANGLADSQVALAVVPGGSTNVFARALGLPRDPLAANSLLIAAAGAGQRFPIGAGQVNGRLFLANAGAGFDVAVLAAVEAHPRLKRAFGPACFVAATAGVTLRRRRRTTRNVLLQVDGQERVAEFVAVLHTGPYSYLGSRRLVLTDGPPLRHGLALVAMDRLGPRELVSRLPRALGSGLDHAGSPGMLVMPTVASLRLERTGPESLVYQVDGEVCVTEDGLQFGYRQDALVVIAPAPDRL